MDQNQGFIQNPDTNDFFEDATAASVLQGGETVSNEEPPVSETPAEMRKHFSRIGLGIFTLTAATLAASLILQVVFVIAAPDIFDQWWYIWLMSLLPLYGVGLPAMWLVLRKVPVTPVNPTYHMLGGLEVPKPSFHIGWWLLIAVVGLGYMNIGAIIGNGLMSVLSALTGYDYSNTLQTALDNSPLWVTFLCTVVVAPLGEEFLFRKLLIDRTRRYGDVVSILLSAFFFALFHGNLFQFFYAFGLGLLLAYLYTRTGHIWWNVGLHALANLIGGALVEFLNSRLDLEGISDGTADLMSEFLAHPFEMVLLYAHGLLSYVYILAAIVLTICMCATHALKLGRGTTQLPRGKRASVVLLNVGMILAILICLGELALNLIPGA